MLLLMLIHRFIFYVASFISAISFSIAICCWAVIIDITQLYDGVFG